eukprot:12926649-Prorocentrum_lima.AAC.1
MAEEMACEGGLRGIKAEDEWGQEWTYKAGESKRRLDYIMVGDNLYKGVEKAWVDEPNKLLMRCNT